jgi:hypothetical protein
MWCQLESQNVKQPPYLAGDILGARKGCLGMVPKLTPEKNGSVMGH